jgi:hypothetical protein
VLGAGERAQELYANWIAAFAARSRQMPALKKVEDDSPFDNSPFGRRNSVERRDEPGQEDIALSKIDEEGSSGPTVVPSRQNVVSITDSGEYMTNRAQLDDPLFHPNRADSGRRYVWNHRPPREGSCIKCY